MRTRLLLPLLLLSGCALESGEGFAVLEPTVRAEYTPVPSRDAGNGFQQLASDFQVRLDAAALGVSGIELIGGSGGGGPTTFDPANPPPGYSLCHNGHCHGPGGELVDYEDIEAELGGGGASSAPVVDLAVGGELDLLAPESRPVTCQPDCELPRTTVTRGLWGLTSVRLEGVVRDNRATPRFPGERPFRLSLAVTDAEAEPLVVLDGELDVPSDRENKPRVKLALLLAVAPTLFDAVDWDNTELGPDGVVNLNPEPPDLNAAVRTQILDALAELSPEAEVEREDR